VSEGYQVRKEDVKEGRKEGRMSRKAKEGRKDITRLSMDGNVS
jgi:hypothetical protein